MKNTKLHRVLWSALLGLSSVFNANAAAVEDFGCTPDLHVEGKYLVDDQGNKVNLHGVMDTPSMWFNSDRWTSWDLGGYVPAAIPRAQKYFTQIFDAITATDQGAYCNIFRLHMEPAWVRKDGDAGKADGGESNLAITYDRDKVKYYLENLFLPIAEDAKAHGLYVIIRPPGVCPGDIQVGDAYQKYLLDVWDIVSKNQYVKDNAGWLSIELANEPVRVKEANGSRPTDGQWGPANGPAKTQYFQPMIDKIRQNGFKGIIWVPGEGYQSSYESYEKYPISDNNFGYAIHVYSGWYGQDDNKCSTQSFIDNVKKQVPGITKKPVVVTECDWSPGTPVGTNFDGSIKSENYGTWATAKTSTWGKAFMEMMDYFDNTSLTLTSTDVYVDMETFIKTGKVQPAFMNKPKPEEASGVACFKWYEEWAHKRLPACEPSIPQTPYRGTPAAIPGKIEAEDFDLGGNKNAYYDVEKENQGGAYRTSEGVDIKEFNGGYKLGWTVKDEWLEYTVNIAEEAAYNFSALVSTDNDEAAFHFELDDEPITATISAANTGDWDDMTTVSGTTAVLPAGEHVLKLVIDGSYFDIDWFEFTEIPQEPFHGVAAAIPGRIEAEDFDLGGQNKAYFDAEPENQGGEYRLNEGVDIKEFNGGYKLGWTVKDEWLEYTVNVAKDGVYDLSALVSTDNDEASFHFELDGAPITETISAANTGDWDEMEKVSATTDPIKAGEHVLKLVVDGSYFDIDWFEFKEHSTAGLVAIDADGTLAEPGLYTVYNSLGMNLGQINIAGADAAQAIKAKAGSNTVVVLKNAKTGKAYKAVTK